VHFQFVLSFSKSEAFSRLTIFHNYDKSVILDIIEGIYESVFR
jgi:hypothetical protein